MCGIIEPFFAFVIQCIDDAVFLLVDETEIGQRNRAIKVADAVSQHFIDAVEAFVAPDDASRSLSKKFPASACLSSSTASLRQIGPRVCRGRIDGCQEFFFFQVDVVTGLQKTGRFGNVVDGDATLVQ
jgi:hypothetical protein